MVRNSEMCKRQEPYLLKNILEWAKSKIIKSRKLRDDTNLAVVPQCSLFPQCSNNQ